METLFITIAWAVAWFFVCDLLTTWTPWALRFFGLLAVVTALFLSGAGETELGSTVALVLMTVWATCDTIFRGLALVVWPSKYKIGTMADGVRRWR